MKSQMLARSELRPEFSDFAIDVLGGFRSTPKTLSPKYFYDARGSELFEQITLLSEYYPTRTELGILKDRGSEIADFIRPGAALIEFGSGSSAKIRALLARAHLGVYVPVDISAEFLAAEAAALRRDFPLLTIAPVAADFMQPFPIPVHASGRDRVGFFPGSTIGNLTPDEALAFLLHAGRILGPRARMIVGVDLVKDAGVLEAAYDDAEGVTAKFNLNLLARINRELSGTIDIESFEHCAVYNAEQSRIEMHLASLKNQSISVLGERFRFAKGETIHTENSYKYTVETFQALTRQAGWSPVRVWTDRDGLFSVHALQLQGDLTGSGLT